jgi:hypothetical protein
MGFARRKNNGSGKSDQRHEGTGALKLIEFSEPGALHPASPAAIGALRDLDLIDDGTDAFDRLYNFHRLHSGQQIIDFAAEGNDTIDRLDIDIIIRYGLVSYHHIGSFSFQIVQDVQLVETTRLMLNQGVGLFRLSS